MGLLFALSIWMLFSYYREIARSFTVLNDDLLTLPRYDKKLNDYFFATIAVLTGFGITLWIWFGTKNLYTKRKKSRIIIRLGQTYTLFYLWATIAIVCRVGSWLPIVLFWIFPNSYFDYHVSKALEIFLPLVSLAVFLFYWHIFRLEFFIGKWIHFSFLSIVFLVLILGNINAINPRIVDDTYNNMFKQEFTYIQKEVDSAKLLNVYFNNETIKTLKEFKSVESYTQVKKVQNAFARKNKVSIDTLILEKIIIHNFKSGSYYYIKDDNDKNWPYPLPEEVYFQIEQYENMNQPEVKFLFEIINQMIIQFNAKQLVLITRDSFDEFSRYDWNLFSQHRKLQYSTKTILSRLVQVVNKLKSNEKYKCYYYLLPEIDMNVFGEYSRQEYYELNLN